MRLNYIIDGENFTAAGEASGDVKQKLKAAGFPSDAVRRASIVMYEGEINMVIHAGGGQAQVDIEPERILITLRDSGPGIPDLQLAMKEGWSTAPDSIRELGFGAGMGLPNMKRYSDDMQIETEVGKGTTVRMIVRVGG